MAGADRREEALHFVEEIGLLFEQGGLPRMAGRVLGWLMVSAPPTQTMDELATALQASKGSISTTTRMLIQFGLIERVALPGQRRDYFRVKPGAWSQLNRARLVQMTAFREVAERGLAVLEGAPPEQTARLEEMRDLFAWFEREFPAMIDRYEQERSAAAERARP